MNVVRTLIADRTDGDRIRVAIVNGNPHDGTMPMRINPETDVLEFEVEILAEIFMTRWDFARWLNSVQGLVEES